MKLYKITKVDPIEGTTFHWCGTQQDAKQQNKAFLDDFDTIVSSWEAVDVPTDKPNLLGWLNTNVNQGHE